MTEGPCSHGDNVTIEGETTCLGEENSGHCHPPEF